MENNAGRDRDAIAIDDTMHQFYKDLTEGSDIEIAPFRTMKDVFMWAVCLGFQSGKKLKITGKRRNIFHWPQFAAQTDVPLLKAIALASSEDVNVLGRQDELLTIAEEFANGGIQQLRASLSAGSSQPLWSLVELVDQEW